MELKLPFIMGVFSLYWALAHSHFPHGPVKSLRVLYPPGPCPSPCCPALQQLEARRLRSSPEKSGSNVQQIWNSLGARRWFSPVLLPQG